MDWVARKKLTATIASTGFATGMTAAATVRSPVDPGSLLLNAAVKGKLGYVLSNDLFKDYQSTLQGTKSTEVQMYGFISSGHMQKAICLLDGHEGLASDKGR